jgi:uncharacterized protein (DUF2141 family)
MVRALTILAAAVVLTVDLAAAQQPRPNAPLRPRRDRPAEAMATGTARLAGRVVAADTGRPLKRARVSVQVTEGRFSKTAITDENGRFSVPNLPAGKYSVSATKTGYVTMAAGQRRALRSGIPIELGDGRAVTNIDLRLPRGGVITGRIRDEDDEPLARATVRVMRFQYQRGERRLVPAGSDQTDDRGEYRVFGLPPGEFVVTAVAGTFERFARTSAGDALVPEADEPLNYAPTYYPGVTSVAEASRVAVGAGQEQTGIDFSLLLVPTARVRGVVSAPAGGPAVRARVLLIPDEAGGALRGPGYRAATDTDLTFTIESVPPGRYVAVANAGGGREVSPLFAGQSITVSGSDIDGLVLTLTSGATMSGIVRFEGVGRPVDSTENAGVGLVPFDQSFGGAGNTSVNADGTFRLANIPPGRHALRVRAPKGWTVKSATLDGRDVNEEIFDVKGAQTISGVEIVLSDRAAGISGMVKADGDPAGTTVILFPVDSARWVPQSRSIVTAQVDREGRYAIDGLPAGDYMISAIEDVEPGEWFDPAFLQAISSSAARIALNEGARETRDLRLTAIP